MYFQMYVPCMKRCCGFAVMNEQERYDYRFWDAGQELGLLRNFYGNRQSKPGRNRLPAQKMRQKVKKLPDYAEIKGE